MILRQLASAWVRATCPIAEMQNDFLQRLEEAIDHSVGCSFLIGRELTADGKPYLVHCFCGELFAFQLTPRQASRLNVNDASFVSALGLTPHHHEPHPEPLVRLEQVDVDRASALDRSQPITGTLKYLSKQWWRMPLAIQAACEPPGGTHVVGYQYFENLSCGEGAIQFSAPLLGELRGHDGELIAGVLSLFFQLCIVGEPEKTRSTIQIGGTMPFDHFPPMPTAPASPPRFDPQKLGEPFISPSPIPSLMIPETMTSLFDPWPVQPNSAANPNRFRSISDIRAVLVELDETRRTESTEC